MGKTIQFKNDNLTVDYDPRNGVCNRCRYVVGEVHPATGKVYQRSHMHHESYNPKDVLADTIELCPSCHGETRRNPPPKKPKREMFIRLTTDTYSSLKNLGKMGDDFEDVIARLLREHNKEGRHGS